RLSGLVEDVHHIVDSLDNVAVADAHALVGRLDGELVSAARVALLVVVQPFEAALERGIRLRLLAAARGSALARSTRKADRAVERIRTRVGLLALAGELIAQALVARRRELARLRAARADARYETRCARARR